MEFAFIDFREQVCLITGAGSENGRIVNVSSVTGPVVSNPGEASYSAAGETLVVDGGNTIQEYKGPSDMYY